MSCRKSIRGLQKTNVVWFGSIGVGEEIEYSKTCQDVQKRTYDAFSISNQSTPRLMCMPVYIFDMAQPRDGEYIRLSGNFMQVTSEIDIDMLYIDDEGVSHYISNTYDTNVPDVGIALQSVDYHVMAIKLEPGYDTFNERTQITTLAYTAAKRNAIFVSDKKSIGYEQEGVASSLIQRLSVIQGELWYKIEEGLPLFSKNVSVVSMDSFIIQTIMSHKDVINIMEFQSSYNNHEYHCQVTVQSKYGDIQLTV